MNYKMIRYIIGMILMAESAFMVLPMLVSVIYGEYEVIMPFVYSIAAAFCTASIFGLKNRSTTLFLQEKAILPLPQAGFWFLFSGQCLFI